MTVFEPLISEFAADYLVFFVRVGVAPEGKDNLKTQSSKTEKYGRGSRGYQTQKRLLMNTGSKLLDPTAEIPVSNLIQKPAIRTFFSGFLRSSSRNVVTVCQDRSQHSGLLGFWSLSIVHSTRCHIPEAGILHCHRREKTSNLTNVILLVVLCLLT